MTRQLKGFHCIVIDAMNYLVYYVSIANNPCPIVLSQHYALHEFIICENQFTFI